MNENLLELKRRINKKYVPPKDQWEPPDKALYGVGDFNLFEVPTDEAEALRFDAIKYSFNLHYQKNPLYRQFCQERGVKPADIKDPSDYSTIPLLPDKFFKDYPEGRDFAKWLDKVYTPTMPALSLNGKAPSYDSVIAAAEDKGAIVTYSSGTSGQHTFVPRDQATFNRSQYSIVTAAIGMLDHWYDPEAYAYLLGPNPSKTNIYVGKVVSALSDAVKDVRYAIDREITTKLIRISMGNPRGLKEKAKAQAARLTNSRRNKKMDARIIRWLEEREHSGDKILFAEAPFILERVMSKLEDEDRSFNFGEKGAVMTGGGWKAQEGKRMPVEEFRERVERILGIPPRNCMDLYAMCEANWYMVHCTEGHYLHIPHSLVYPMVLDEGLEPVGYGESGRLAFLDPLATSYPGFIMTGDRVKLLESCPACDRPGPVLEPEIHRMEGEEIRGCAEELRSTMTEEVS